MAYIDFFAGIVTLSTILHVLAAVCAMGAAFSADVLFHFFAADKQLMPGERQTLSLLSRVVWYGLAAVVVTGAMIFMADPAGYLMSVKFLAKMTVVGILIANGAVLDRYVHAHLIRKGFLSSRREAFARRVAFACGSISAVSWVSVLAFGVMDGITVSYGSVMTLYGAIVICAVLGSLVVERTIFTVKK